MKKILLLLGAAFILSALSSAVVGQFKQTSPDNIWQEIEKNSLRSMEAERLIRPSAYRVFALDKNKLQDLLRRSPLESHGSKMRDTKPVLTLPMPDGNFARFRIEESPIMEPELAAKFPEIKTYRGQGVDDPTATVRFDFTPQGFHSMILSSSGTVLVDPYTKGETDNYISYFKRDAAKQNDFVCHVGEDIDKDFYKSEYDYLRGLIAPEVTSGATLRTYRLALAATGEYTQAVGGGTVAGALAAQVTVMNRVNGVYERDFAIRMTIIANNNLIIYTNGATDPYSNNSGSAMLSQNQTNLDTVIGSANYDIGHVFSTGGGGIASLRSPCSSGKARGVTGLPNPVGDPFAIDYVAHEIGHQYGANHTFNATDGNRAASAAYEPGSGITIMGYAGLFGSQDLANNSIDTFHVRSLEEVIAFKENPATGGSCGTASATGNTPPNITLTGGTTWNIPEQTPFALSAEATDINGDAITYDWQEYDLGPSTSAVPNSDSDGNARPIFRPYLPTTGGTRFFPSLQFILNNANVPPATTGGFLTGEILPSITRTMLFQVIARDNRAGGGGVNTATATVNVTNNIGPFVVTSPNTNVTFNGLSSQTVTWNVANTTNAPVSAANVRILLSTDGGMTFPIVLAESTPNDGSHPVTMPNITTSQARIKIEAVGNIFFDISNTNFSINSVIPTVYNLSGAVNYAIMPANLVSGVSLNASGVSNEATNTDINGIYQFLGLTAGNYTVTPSKTGQVNGISNSDATAVAQFVANLISLTPNQQAAADVSGNGSVSSLDATYIAQYVASVPNPGLTGAWRFSPSNRSYPNLQTNLTNENYSAILLGEVTGNWNPIGPNSESAEQTVERPQITEENNRQIKGKQRTTAVAVSASQTTLPEANFSIELKASDTTGKGIFGYEFDFLYDPEAITPQANPCDNAGTLSDTTIGRTVICNPVSPGLLRVVMFSSTGTPVSGEGILLKLNFTAVGAAGASSPLTLRNFMFNEGLSKDIIVNGQIQIAGLGAVNAPVKSKRFGISDLFLPAGENMYNLKFTTLR